MSLPTKGETYEKLNYHLRMAQESAAMMAHLTNAQENHGVPLAAGWLTVEDLLKKMVHKTTLMASAGLH